MTSSPLSVLCPIDFSEASFGALRYAAAIVESSHGQLMVMTVDDPLLASMDAARGHEWPSDQTRKDLERAVTDTLGMRALGLDLRYHVPIGEPAPEILRVAAERPVDLVVMSSHGLTGVRKLFFGSTTERVLRRATVPVLVTRSGDRGPIDSVRCRLPRRAHPRAHRLRGRAGAPGQSREGRCRSARQRAPGRARRRADAVAVPASCRRAQAGRRATCTGAGKRWTRWLPTMRPAIASKRSSRMATPPRRSCGSRRIGTRA